MCIRKIIETGMLLSQYWTVNTEMKAPAALQSVSHQGNIKINFPERECIIYWPTCGNSDKLCVCNISNIQDPSISIFTSVFEIGSILGKRASYRPRTEMVHILPLWCEISTSRNSLVEIMLSCTRKYVGTTSTRGVPWTGSSGQLMSSVQNQVLQH